MSSTYLFMVRHRIRLRIVQGQRLAANLKLVFRILIFMNRVVMKLQELLVALDFSQNVPPSNFASRIKAWRHETSAANFAYTFL